MVDQATQSPAEAVAQLQSTARMAEEAGDLDRALGFFRALRQIQPRHHRWAFEEVRLLRKAGRAAEAADALREALKRWPRALYRDDVKAMLPEAAPKEGRAIKALGDDIPSDKELRRPLVEDDGAADFIMGEGGRKTAVIVFTGLADRMVMPLPVFDRFLAELDVTGIYLRDRRRIGFFKGVKSLADDYEGTIERLEDLLAEKGVRTVHTLGNSAGGMAAVSYGIDLGARTVMGFSAPVALVAATKDVDRRVAVFSDRILYGVPESRRDLRGRLAAAPQTTVKLFYGADMPEDRYHASALEGLPNTELHPIQGMAGHGALYRVAETGQLRPMLRATYGAPDED
ncbi:MAG TPA: hypothetical protein VEA15_05315 [Caulobacteraceae bacterium]|nr:hypothetical protein [Caulobacteraceae bacterium]